MYIYINLLWFVSYLFFMLLCVDIFALIPYFLDTIILYVRKIFFLLFNIHSFIYWN